MVDQNTISPIIDDIQIQYTRYRELGKTRDASIESIRSRYALELQDTDDRLAVLIGLCLSLCRKGELFQSLATDALNEIYSVLQERLVDDATYVYLEEVEARLKDASAYGDEAMYKQASVYIPDWSIGDMFSHTISYPAAEALGIMGWVILLYKVGEYIDNVGGLCHLMYVAVSPPEKVPSCDKDVQKLVFLRMMQLGNRTEYLAQITIKSKKEEDAYGLTRIGCYPNIRHPDGYTNENPLTAMPLFGRIKRSDRWPSYEDQICRIYKKYGLLP